MCMENDYNPYPVTDDDELDTEDVDPSSAHARLRQLQLTLPASCQLTSELPRNDACLPPSLPACCHPPLG